MELRFTSVVVCGVYTLLSCVSGYEIQTLSSYLWDVKSTNNTFQLKGTIPGGIYSDLRKAGILNETIYYRFNDVNYRWVAYENWTYSVSFSVNEFNIGKKYELVFHGLDGHSKILLNNHLIGKTANTFVRYRFDISNLLNQDTNFLEVNFESPIVSGNRLASQSNHSIPLNCVPPDYHGECHVNYLRRMPASYGWDWGLAAPSVGIWKHAELVSYQEDLIIRDVTAVITDSDKYWKVTVQVFCEGPLHSNTDINGEIILVLYIENNTSIDVLDTISLNSSTKEREVVLTKNMYVPKILVNLWWPNGYGDQNLYNLTATFRNEISTNSKTVFIAFREVKLIEDLVNASDPSHGRTFYFLVNGFAIFAKGSNYIPHSIFPDEAGDKHTIVNLLQAVKETNMNILRVWGGGIYADDFFYEECDRLGIMVWQDMMFACSMYPADATFLTNVQNEISQQIKRLQHHASIIIWSGNNENEAALSGNWYNTKHDEELFKKEYVKLYVDTVKKTLLKYDSTRHFLVSSPTNGIQSDYEGYISRNPYSPLFGDIHFYNYLSNSWHADHYPMTRFSSEYGFQSLPSLSSLREVATEEDLSSIVSEFFVHRQHLPLGYLYMVYQLLLHFPPPKLNDLQSIIYLSQISQAWSVKCQTEWYRKWRSYILPNGEGLTMGAMYWQLNDVWQAPSWSSIEFGGKWKMLHYYAKNFFAPVIITAHLHKNGEISASLVSDLLKDLPEVEIRVTIYNWRSFSPVRSFFQQMTVKKESSHEYLKTNVTELLESNSDCKSSYRTINTKCFLKFTLTDTKTGDLIHENFLFPSPFTLIEDLQLANIQLKVESCSKLKICTISVHTNTISLFVWLDVNQIPGHFSDNGFVMTGSRRNIVFYPQKQITAAELRTSLSVTVLDRTRLDTFSHPVDVNATITIFVENLSNF